MLKTILKLSILAIIPIFFLFFLDNYNVVKSLLTWQTEEDMSFIYKKTIETVARQLEATPPTQREEVFNEVSSYFRNDLQLLNLSEIQISNKHRQRLNSGEFVYLDHEDETFGLKVKNSDLVLTISFEVTDTELTGRLISTPVALAQKFMAQYPQEEWYDLLSELKFKFGHEVILISSTWVEVLKKIYTFNQTDNFIWCELKENDDVYVFSPLSNKQYLMWHVSGDAPNTFKNKIITYIVSLIFILFILSVTFMIFVWPLYRDFKHLNQVALNFGSGNLNSRAVVKKQSFTFELSNSFNQMANNIEDMIENNENLTNAVAHDLRTPLTRLRFALEILKSKGFEVGKECTYIESMQTSIKQLDHLINQTLVHSRYKRNTEYKYFNNTNFSDQIYTEVNLFSAEHKHIEFSVNIEKKLLLIEQFVDDKALLRALSNLIENACRYAQQKIIISYSIQNGYISLKVNDDGPGIKKVDRERILEPFVQIENVQRSVIAGHGLGLAIVKQVAKWHNGEVIVGRSNIGGASIKLIWPCNPRK